MPAPCGQDGRSFHGSCRPPGRPVLTPEGFSVRTTSRGDRLARRALSSGAITSRVGSYTVGTRAGPATPGFLECCSLHGPHWWVAWQAGRWQPPPPLTHWHLAGVWVADPAGDQRPGSVSSGQLVSGGDGVQGVDVPPFSTTGRHGPSKCCLLALTERQTVPGSLWAGLTTPSSPMALG